jgi:hypothetical protein
LIEIQNMLGMRVKICSAAAQDVSEQEFRLKLGRVAALPQMADGRRQALGYCGLANIGGKLGWWFGFDNHHADLPAKQLRPNPPINWQLACFHGLELECLFLGSHGVNKLVQIPLEHSWQLVEC